MMGCRRLQMEDRFHFTGGDKDKPQGNGFSFLDTIDQLNRVLSMSSPSSSSSFTYDLNGNRATKNDGTVTHTCSYDRENRLVVVNDGSADIFTAVYDYRTRRISKLENGSTTNYVYDGGVNVQELDAARSLTKQLVRGTGQLCVRIFQARHSRTRAVDAVSVG